MEERVGQELLRDLRITRTMIIKKSTAFGEGSEVDPFQAKTISPNLRISRVSINDARLFYGDLMLLTASDIKRYKLVESRSQCFTPRELADVRSLKINAVKLKGYINKQVKMWRNESGSSILDYQYYDWIVTIYPTYKSIIN